MKAANVLRVLGEKKLRMIFIETPLLLEENFSKKPIFELNVGGTCLVFLMKEWVVRFLVYLSLSQITWVLLWGNCCGLWVLPVQGVGLGHWLGAAPAQGHQAAPWNRTRLGHNAGPWVRFRIRLGEANWSQILLQDCWVQPWRWSGTPASSSCFLCGVWMQQLVSSHTLVLHQTEITVFCLFHFTEINAHFTLSNSHCQLCLQFNVQHWFFALSAR